MDLEIKETYYQEERAYPGDLFLIFSIVGVIADILAISLALREFLKNNDAEIKRVQLRTESISLDIEGDISDQTIEKIIRESCKTREKKH